MLPSFEVELLDSDWGWAWLCKGIAKQRHTLSKRIRQQDIRFLLSSSQAYSKNFLI